MPSIEYLLALPPAVTLSLVITLDGQLCGPDFSSRSISGEEDLEWLRRLRAASDAIVVGAATAQREQYRAIKTRPEYVGMRRGMSEHPDVVVLRSKDRFDQIRSALGPRVLLEAGVRLHAALASEVDRIWLSHSPTMVGNVEASFRLPMHNFALVDRFVGTEFVFSRFDRLNQH